MNKIIIIIKIYIQTVLSISAIYSSLCDLPGLDCSLIGGNCINNTCLCSLDQWYNGTIHQCETCKCCVRIKQSL